MITEIVKTIDDILKNEKNQPLYVLGGYIVGATIVKDGIEEVYKEYPLLEEIAELGADLETMEDDTYALPVFQEIQEKFAALKSQLAE